MIESITFRNLGIHGAGTIDLKQLNCVYGPNESGKSTLFDGLCYALVDKAKSSSFIKDFIKRYGDKTEVAIKSTLDLEHGQPRNFFNLFAYDSRRLESLVPKGILETLSPEGAQLTAIIDLLAKDVSTRALNAKQKKLEVLDQQIFKMKDSLVQAEPQKAIQKNRPVWPIALSGLLGVFGAFGIALFKNPLELFASLALLLGGIISFTLSLLKLKSRQGPIIVDRTNTVDPVALEKEITELQKKRNDLHESISISKDCYNIFSEIHNNQSTTSIEDKIAYWYSQLGGSTVPRSFERDLKDHIVTDATGVERCYSLLSRGTAEAYCIAQRLAIAAIVKPKNGILLFDEPIVHMDETRREKAIRGIIEFALEHNYQLLYFTKSRTLQKLFNTFNAQILECAVERIV